MKTDRTRALITGASRGLGRALATALAADGWSLVVTARTPEALEETREFLRDHATGAGHDTSRIIAVAGSVTDPTHRAAIADAARELGGLDVVVNNAGALGPSPQPSLLAYPGEVLVEVLRTNVVAPLDVVQAVAPSLSAHATIVNVTSDAGVEAYPGWGGYGASKAALEHLSRVLAVENQAWRVLHVDPGDMRTEMHQAAFPGEDISDRPLPSASVPGLVSLLRGDQPSGRYVAREMTDPEAPATAAATGGA